MTVTFCRRAAAETITPEAAGLLRATGITAVEAIR